MIKINIQKWVSVIVASFIGAGIGVCIGMWFRLPDHTVDVFAFVESALGIGLTGLALIVTLGVIRQSAAMETMLATKKDEMVAEVKSKLEIDTFSPFRSQYMTEFASLTGRVETVQSSLKIIEENWLIPLNDRIKQFEKQNGNMPPASSERRIATLPEDDL
jgi:hypothetical protein